MTIFHLFTYARSDSRWDKVTIPGYDPGTLRSCGDYTTEKNRRRFS